MIDFSKPVWLEKLKEAAEKIADEIETNALTPGIGSMGVFSESGELCANCVFGHIFARADVLEDLVDDETSAAEHPAEWFAGVLYSDVRQIVEINDDDGSRQYSPMRWRKHLVWHVRSFARDCGKAAQR